MDEALQSRVEVLAHEFAGQAQTMEDVNELMRLMMKSALERMLDTEMDVHLGRRPLRRGGFGAPRARQHDGLLEVDDQHRDPDAAALGDPVLRGLVLRHRR